MSCMFCVRLVLDPKVFVTKLSGCWLKRLYEAYTGLQRHSVGNLLFRVRFCRLQVLKGIYSDTKHSGYRFSCNPIKIALRGIYEFTVASVCFDTGSSMQMNNGCGISEVTSNVHEVIGYQLDDIRIYLSTEFGNRSIGSRYEIPTRWYYADPECFGTGY